MTIDRAALAERIIREGTSDRFLLRLRCDDTEWLERFPGGFAPIPKVAEGEVLSICTDRIVEVGDNMDDDEFELFCRAIVCWQRETMLSFSMQYAPDLVAMEFADRFPVEAACFLRAADDRDMTLVAFLGADKR